MASITLKPDITKLGAIKLSRQRDRPAGPAAELAGQTFILTGASSGYGLACAKLLPALGVVRLVLGVRSVERGEVAADLIRREHPSCEIEVWGLEMDSYESIKGFAQRCAKLERVDSAILNAGVAKLEFVKSPLTGHEETIQMNYLSTALLAILLLPVLKSRSASSGPGRLTIVGSGTGYEAKFDERKTLPLLKSLDKEWAGTSAGSERYGVSKLLVTMLVYKLGQLVNPSDVILNNFCPGFSPHTALSRDAKGPLFALGLSIMKVLYGRTPEQGAWAYIDAVAVKGKESHGSFIFGWKMFPFNPLMYTQEGREIMGQLWAETIAELQKFGVHEALETMKVGHV